MNHQLLLQNGMEHNLLDNKTPFLNHKKNNGQQKNDSQEKKVSKLPSFYTEPIFKAKKHNCL